MPEHKLPHGLLLIDGIHALGAALGYYPKKEHELPGSQLPKPANDVAWLRDSRQTHPIMIFEVESQTSNTMAHNVTKVYGQSDRNKPLFFFHIFLDGKSNAPRIAELGRLFGLQNYRTYPLIDEPLDAFIIDVLAQHRRISLQLPVAELIRALSHSAWNDTSLNRVLTAAEDLEFDDSTATFLPAYARLAPIHTELPEQFINYLQRRGPNVEVDQYETYFGLNWSEVIHPAVLCTAVGDQERSAYVLKLKAELADSIQFNVVSRNLGQGHDYDNFVMDILPAFLALLAVLTRRVADLTPLIAARSSQICDALGRVRRERSVFSAVWALHVLCMANDESRFEFVRSYVNERGGVSDGFLFQPPGMGGGFEGGSQWDAEVAQGDPAMVPPLAQFRARLSIEALSKSAWRQRAIRLALRYLSEEEAWRDEAGEILALLHCTIL